MNNYIKGIFKKAFYKSDKGYTIGLFKVKETNDEEVEDYIGKTITITGYFDDLKEDENYIMYGEALEHPKYGFQFDVKKYEKIMPNDKEGLITFLSGEMFIGVGEKLATLIVDKLGLDAINKILNNKEVLYNIPKISKIKADKIYETLKNNTESHEDIVYLCDLGFNMKDALTIYNKYKTNTIPIIENNIYSIIDEDITFLKVDYLKEKLNIPLNDERRIKACTYYMMNNLIYTNGDTYLDKDEIIESVFTYLKLDIDIEIFDSIFEELKNENYIEIIDDKYYLKDMYINEKNIVNKLKKINQKEKTIFKKIDHEIEYLEVENGIKYNELQKEAIKNALTENLTIITGGPGTGKTTIIKAIVVLYKRLKKLSYDELIRDLALLAPTGRASKRMCETTLYPASTIHRFLKWNKENNTFGICENNKDKSKLIIVDETSMIDINLFSSLLSGLTDNIKLILVGDYDQLPSVGPGLILKDLIESKKIKTIKLEYLYRQNSDSYINLLAKEIKENNISANTFKDYIDYRFLKCPSNCIKASIKNICNDLIKHGYDYKRVQIMAPMYKGENGIDNLNIILQNIFNPKDENKKEVTLSNITYRVNDKILELVNMPEENVFNGDIGILCDIIHPPFSESGKTEIYVDYDGNIVKYLPKDLVKIKHGFAISIHKSQGGEFEFVIIPIAKSYSRMLYRKLIYTGVTRAKKKLILLGEEEAFKMAVSSNYSTERKTNLKNLIIECF